MSTRSRIAAVGGAVLVAVLATAGPALADPPVNGSFEDPPLSGNTTGQIITPTSAETLPGWTVVAGAVFHMRLDPPLAAAEGVQAVNLAFEESGTITQDFPTEAGKTYTVTWSYGTLPRNFCETDNPPTPEVRTGTFSVGSVVVDMTITVSTSPDMKWTPESAQFTGTGSPVTLQFADTTGSTCGLAIDNVQIAAAAVIPIIDPIAATWFASGAAVIGATAWLVVRRRRSTALVSQELG